MQRPLKYEQLLSMIKRFYGRNLSMLFIAGHGDKVIFVKGMSKAVIEYLIYK